MEKLEDLHCFTRLTKMLVAHLTRVRNVRYAHFEYPKYGHVRLLHL